MSFVGDMIIGRQLLLVTVWAVFDICRSTCLYDFGVAAGDTRIFPDDDSAHIINLATPFRFYGTNRNPIWMSSNGVVTFDASFTSFKPKIDITEYGPIVAVFHDDLFNDGFDAYHRQSTTPKDLQLSTAFVRKLFPPESTFTATRAIVITWDRFKLYSVPSDVNPVLTLQTALISSNTISVVINLYVEINHSKYNATIGVHAGDKANFKTLCVSRTFNTTLVDERAQQSDSTNGLFGFIVEIVTPVQLGDGTCLFDCDCIDLNAECNQSGICLCRTEFVDSNTVAVLGGSCLPRVPNLGVCVITTQCIDENAVCHNTSTSICNCKSGYELIFNICHKLPETSIWCFQDRDNQNIVNVYVTILRNISFGLQSLKTESFDKGLREEPEDPRCRSPVSPPNATLVFTIDLTNTSFPGCGVKLDNDVINVTIEAIQEDHVYQANDTIYRLSCNIMPAHTSADHGVGEIANSGPLDRSGRSIRMDIMYVGRNVVATEAILGQYLTIRITFDTGVNSSIADPLGVTPLSCEAGDSPNFFLSQKMLVDGCVPSESYPALKLKDNFVRTSSPSDRVWLSRSGSFQAGYFITTNRLYIRCTVRFCNGLKLDECIESCNSTGSRRKRDDIPVRIQTIESSIVIKDIQEITEGNCVDESIAYLVLGTLSVLIALTLTASVVMFAYLMK